MSLRMIVDTLEVCKGSNGLYYRLNGINYDIHFPLCWALENRDTLEAGPHNCWNCNIYGYCNGVFIAYCSNCTVFRYNLTRGKYDIYEREGEIFYDTYIKFENFYYLKGMTMEQIGDKDLALDKLAEICYDTEEMTSDSDISLSQDI